MQTRLYDEREGVHERNQMSETNRKRENEKERCRERARGDDIFLSLSLSFAAYMLHTCKAKDAKNHV